MSQIVTQIVKNSQPSQIMMASIKVSNVDSFVQLPKTPLYQGNHNWKQKF